MAVVADRFSTRHIGSSPTEVAAMLTAVGAADIESFIDRLVPESIRLRSPMGLPPALSEVEATARLRSFADRNVVATSLIGMGYYGTITPPVLTRNILENPAWYTAYTPYQPEISQGRLEALLNFQTMVCDLTGLDLANASLLDEATAAAEAMALAHRAQKSPSNLFFVDRDTHPQTIAVLQTRAEPVGIEIVIGDVSSLDPSTVFAALLSYPGSSGQVRDLRPTIAALHDAGRLAVVVTDLLALVLLESPGELGADIAVGSSQRFGVPMGFGGPHAAFMATRAAFTRSLPGRVVGVSTDTAGRPALRLALQTREQHIRREKATSNICTAQVLLAVMAGMYAVWHGPEGLTRIANNVHELTSRLAHSLREGGVEVVNTTWFDTLTVRVADAADIVARAASERVNLRLVDADTIGISFDETSTDGLVATVLALICGGGERATSAGTVGHLHPATDGTTTPGASASDSSVESRGGGAGEDSGAGKSASTLPDSLRRIGEILTHPVFHAHRSEHAMLRYLRRLADRDLALDRTMIPLGSCTMKLNATTEMLAITWPEFANIHPFAPLDQVGGYLDMIHELEDWLTECTGYAAVSLQPNAGSQGEFSGLLAIRAYHRSRGEAARDICLIPSSAHGTNAASAVMAGMKVVVVACDSDGNVDVDDLRAKADLYAAQLAAVMVTYPSTHGVFETAIGEICDIVHAHGGQVYVDGANLNALVGLARPGRFGADVSHLNLHKTFCIPHGGGGPGVGPVAVGKHLRPFLPAHPLHANGSPVGPVSAAPFGSAGILAISWAYIAMMGPDGLRDATTHAILHANYIARRLQDHFPVLYTGEHGDVAHECIIDLRAITKTSGVSVEDVAKRLIDYGFHAPTMSFPVAGTLMIEPTESESKQEIDRFIDAMIAIRAEIDAVTNGVWPAEDNPLTNAPHTAEDVTADEWPHPYPRSTATYPVAGLRHDKYFAPIGRVDGVKGDRNLVCTCPPIESYADAT
jgi:glycine dehydrogenase